MGQRVSHAKGLADDGGHPRPCPDIPAKAEEFRSLGEQSGQLVQLFNTQARLGAAACAFSQSLHALTIRFLEPLAHRTLAYTQSFSDIFLFPAFLFQFPGSQAACFSPILGFLLLFLVHAVSILHSDRFV